jgi:mannosyltransferase
LVLASVGSRQQFQISWIRDVGPAFPYEFTFLQFFADGYFATDSRVVRTPTSGEDTSMVVLAFIMWAAAVTGVVLCRRHFIVLLALPWLVFPAVAVIGGSLITGGDYYLPRYLTFVLPAMALLSAALVLRLRAVGIAARNQRAAVGVATLVVVALCLPSYVGQRTQYGRDRQDDFRFVAESVAKLATPGDSFVISPDRDLVYQAYPEAYKGLGDPTLGITASQWKRVFNQRFDVQAVKEEIRRYHTVILIENSNELTMAAALSDMGYTKGESYEGPSSRVTKYYSK